MRRPIVLLDCDGVLADFIGGLLPVIRDITGRTFVREQVTRFDFVTSLGLSREEGAAIKRWLGDARGWCESLAVYPGAVDGVCALREVADVYIVTSPWNSCATWTHEREAWLRRNFDISHANVLHASAKHLVRGDVFVDDKTEAVVAWQAANPDGAAMRWLTPHNWRDEYAGSSTQDWGVVRSLALGALEPRKP